MVRSWLALGHEELHPGQHQEGREGFGEGELSRHVPEVADQGTRDRRRKEDLEDCVEGGGVYL